VAAAATAQVADVSSKRSAGKSLMIVESPTKAVKIQKFLGDQYKVRQESCNGPCEQQQQ
jgi:reverse gyrase